MRQKGGEGGAYASGSEIACECVCACFVIDDVDVRDLHTGGRLRASSSSAFNIASDFSNGVLMPPIQMKKYVCMCACARERECVL